MQGTNNSAVEIKSLECDIKAALPQYVPLLQLRSLPSLVCPRQRGILQGWRIRPPIQHLPVTPMVIEHTTMAGRATIPPLWRALGRSPEQLCSVCGATCQVPFANSRKTARAGAGTLEKKLRDWEEAEKSQIAGCHWHFDRIEILILFIGSCAFHIPLRGLRSMASCFVLVLMFLLLSHS